MTVIMFIKIEITGRMLDRALSPTVTVFAIRNHVDRLVALGSRPFEFSIPSVYESLCVRCGPLSLRV